MTLFFVFLQKHRNVATHKSRLNRSGAGNPALVSWAKLSCGRRESGQIPITFSFLTRQKFLGMLIGLVANGGTLVPFLECYLESKSCLFRTRPNYVHTYFIRCPAAEYATPKPDGLSSHMRVWPVRLTQHLMSKAIVTGVELCD